MIRRKNLTVYLTAALTAGVFLMPDVPVSAQTRNAAAQNRARYYTPYMQSYYARQGYGVRTPVVTPRPSLPPVTGTVEKYSPVEYGRIVQMTVQAARENTPPPHSRGATVKLTDMATTTTPSGETAYAPISMNISQVIDRGIILLPTDEEMRLRGVSIPSSTDVNQVRRLYGREAMQVLTTATQTGPVTILLDDPLRDTAGRLLGTVILADGTELNSRMIELGYGSVNAQDFGTVVDFSDLQAAETQAKEKRLGVWSR